MLAQLKSSVYKVVAHVMIPGDPSPDAPQAVKDSADRVLGLIKWGSLVCCIGALLGFGFLVAAAERGGYGSGAAEFKERFGKVILAIVVVTTAVPIVLFVMG